MTAPITLSKTEEAWMKFLREIGGEHDPEPTLRLAQLLQRICEARRFDVPTDEE